MPNATQAKTSTATPSDAAPRRPQRISWPTLSAVAVALAVGAAMTLFAVMQSRRSEEERVERAFSTATDAMHAEFARRVERPVYGLNGLRGLYIASKSVERGEFRAYVESRNLPREFPGVHGFGFIQRVERDTVEAFTAAERADGAPGFTVAVTGDGPQLFITKFIELLARNESVVGQDNSGSRTRMEAINEAVRTGHEVVSPVHRLMQDERKRPAVAYFQAVYRNGTRPTTPADREAALAGVLYAPVVLSDMLEGVVDGSEGAVAVEMDDVTVPSGPVCLLKDAPPAQEREELEEGAAHKPRLTVQREINIGGRTWRMTFNSTPAFEAGIDTTGPLVTGIGGGLLTLMLAATVLSIGNARARAVRIAAAMTADLTNALSVAEAAMLETDALRKTIDEHSIVSVADTRGRITEVNDMFCRISGYSRQELIGQDHRIVNSGNHPKAFWVGMWRTVAAGMTWHGEVCNRAKDGSLYWVDAVIAPFTGPDGKVQKYVSIRTDITERKLNEQALIQFKGALDQTLDCVFMFRPGDFRFVYVNEGAVRQVGYSEAELLGMTPLDIKPAFTLEMFKAMVKPLLEGTQASHTFETIHRRKDGTDVPVEVGLQLVRQAGGEPRFVAIVRDITERRAAEQKLRDAEAFLRSAIDSLDSHTVVLNGQARIVSVNRAWREFALANGGAGLALLEGADYIAACENASPACPEAALVAQAVRAVLAGDSEPAPIEYACHSPTEQRWFLCSIRGFKRGDERFAAVSHLNITAVKESQMRLEQANAELTHARSQAESANRTKSEFLANMSHEIRTPLTAILGFADLLAEDAVGPEAINQRSRNIDTIKLAGQHLLTVINDILDLSKLDADRMTVELTEVSAVEVLREVTSLMRPRALGKGVDLKAALNSPVPQSVLSDSTRLRQILMNLIGNAVKFTESGAVTVSMSATESDGTRRLVVDVEDTGPGMNPEQAGRLFAAFGQADGTVTRRHGGTGLGLVISRRLANLMGGDVKLLWSEPGKGSCFRLVLPLEAAEGSAMTTTFDAVTVAQSASAAAAMPSLNGRILLAEDGIDNQRLIVLHLKRAGAIVDVAENGKLALDMCEKAANDGTPYDLLLTDMQMPVMDGYTLARTLREHGNRVAIVALTAHAMAEDRERCLAAGCDDYASKPIDKHALVRTCWNWLGKPGGVSAPQAAA